MRVDNKILTASRESFVRPSAVHNRYFSIQENGCGAAPEVTYIPIGMNLCFPRFDKTEAAGLERYALWLDALANNGGNFARLWLGHSFFDVEPQRAGVFDAAAALRLDKVLAMAQERGILLKLTLEHFRTIGPRAEAEIFPGAASFSKPVYASQAGGMADSMQDFLDNPLCRARYLQKLDWLAERYAGHPAIFGWELWNEMNAVDAPDESWLEWSRQMLLELRERFPCHLVMQSLGSYDSDYQTGRYADYAALGGADLVQVHRYLDPGAGFSCCHGAMDILCADAVSVLRQMAPRSPVLLAECGAVEAHHSAPSKLYAKDSEGILLHDEIFAAFFAGAAGCGQAWHWDFYVERHNLWHHFAAFKQALEGFDPVAQMAQPVTWETPQVRVYALRGINVSLLWLRDKGSDWQSELVYGKPPALLEAQVLTVPDVFPAVCSADSFNPWTTERSDCAVQSSAITVPPFSRSVVLRLFH